MFVQRRDEAVIQGLLAPNEGAMFLNAAVAANLIAAESAAREALALAGIDPDSATPTIDPSFPSDRRSEVAADCYTLLLVLASVRAQRPPAHPGDQDRYWESLRLLDDARKLGF